jgi:hypothetical protein
MRAGLADFGASNNPTLITLIAVRFLVWLTHQHKAAIRIYL